MQMREQIDERTKGLLPPWRKSIPFECRRVSAGGDGPAPQLLPLSHHVCSGWRGTCSLQVSAPLLLSFTYCPLSTFGTRPWASHWLKHGVSHWKMRWPLSCPNATSESLYEAVPFLSVQDAVLIPPDPGSFASLSSGLGHPLPR